MKNLANINLEIELIKREANLILTKNDNNKDEILAQLISIRNESKLFGKPTESYLEWYSDQMGNNLPHSSSGSFLTAVTDMDNFIYAIEGMDDTELSIEEYDMIESIFKNEIFTIR